MEEIEQNRKQEIEDTILEIKFSAKIASFTHEVPLDYLEKVRKVILAGPDNEDLPKYDWEFETGQEAYAYFAKIMEQYPDGAFEDLERALLPRYQEQDMATGLKASSSNPWMYKVNPIEELPNSSHSVANQPDTVELKLLGTWNGHNLWTSPKPVQPEEYKPGSKIIGWIEGKPIWTIPK